MIQKKVCMIGEFATGKTSLVSRFVHSIFSEKYQTTVGVKIDKKQLEVNNQKVNLILWDLHGEDEFQKLRLSYLRGSSGFLLVVDGTRSHTLEKALDLRERVEKEVGEIPFILLLNKWDLQEEWEIDESEVNDLLNNAWKVIKSSAKTGLGVEEAFYNLTLDMLEK